MAFFGGLTMCSSLLAGTFFTIEAAFSMFFRFGNSKLPALFLTAATEAGGDQVGGRDVADRARGCGDHGGDAGVAFGTDAGFEADRGRVADFVLPGRADLREVVGEGVGVTRAVAAVHRGDRQVGQFGFRVDLLDLRVVPVGDLAEVDAGEDLAGQVQFLHAGDVEAEAGGGEGPGDLHAAVAGSGLFRGQRRVGGAEVDGPGGDLGDARAGADRTVGDFDVRGLRLRSR